MIHRVDGPIAVYRGMDDGTDERIQQVNNALADVTIFQSVYSMEAHKKIGLNFASPHLIIPNTPDPSLFTPNMPTCNANNKIRLISTSWSDNPNKGLDTYLWLDQNLDWTRYEYTFIGRINTPLTNIKHIQPVDSATLASYLKQSDIFITASRHDPCSNSLAEALACGLPALHLNSGGHGELVKEGGISFNSPEEIPTLLEKILANYAIYQQSIFTPSLSDIADSYLRAMGLA